MADLSINGTPVSSLGWWIELVPDARSTLATTHQTVGTQYGRGALVAGLAGFKPRVLAFRGGVLDSANTTTALVTAIERLKDLIENSGLLTLKWDDGTTFLREIDAVPTGLSLPEPSGHPFLAVKETLAVSFLSAPESDWRALAGSSVALAAAATRYQVPLGTAPSPPIIRIQAVGSNAVNPVVTIRDAAGVAQITLTFTVTLVSNEDFLDIDCERGVLELSDNGVRSNANSLLTSGSASFPFSLQPAWGDREGGFWATVEVSAGQGEVLYAKRYR